jgi:hypothetical protein
MIGDYRPDDDAVWIATARDAEPMTVQLLENSARDGSSATGLGCRRISLALYTAGGKKRITSVKSPLEGSRNATYAPLEPW